MYLSRHSDMISDVDLNQQIIVFGAGSIGSYAVLSLSKLGYTNIAVFDDGIVEAENIAPQFYRPQDIGKLKVDCLKKMIKQQSNCDIIAIPKRIDETTLSILKSFPMLNLTIVVAVDSMVARKFIFKYVPYNHLIDARMAIEFLTIISFTRNLEAIEDYRDTLFDDSESVQEACTNKAISYTSLIAGGLVSKALLDLHKGKNSKLSTLNFDINAFDMVKL